MTTIYRYQDELLHEQCATAWVEEDSGLYQTSGEDINAYFARAMEGIGGTAPVPAEPRDGDICAHCAEELVFEDALHPNY